MSQRTGKLKQIESLRGLAAITVFVWHTHVLIDDVLPFRASVLFRGDIANVFFFVLSGFLVTWEKKDNYKNMDVYLFIKKKMQKIYLLWAISTLYMMIFEAYIQWKANRYIDISTLSDRGIKHLLLIQSWFPYNNASNELNGPGWFLSVLLFLWLMTKLLLGIYEWTEKRFGKYTGIVCFAELMFCYIIYALTNSHLGGFFRGIFVYWILFSYSIGILLGKYIKCINIRLNIVIFQITLVFGLVISLILTNKFFSSPFAYLFVTFFVSEVIVYTVSRTNEGIINRILENSVLLGKTGKISFEIYIIHVPVYKTVTYIGLLENKIIQFISIIVITLFCIYLYKSGTQLFHTVFSTDVK